MCGPNLKSYLHTYPEILFILLKFWQFTQKLLMRFYGFSMGYIWGKTNFESSLMLLWWFECEKVDLTAEIKISENVLCLEHCIKQGKGSGGTACTVLMRCCYDRFPKLPPHDQGCRITHFTKNVKWSSFTFTVSPGQLHHCLCVSKTIWNKMHVYFSHRSECFQPIRFTLKSCCRHLPNC